MIRSTHPYIMDDNIKKLSASWDYSTEEVDTGQKWIDGKSIYCKVIVLDNVKIGNNVDTTVTSNYGVAQIIDIDVLTPISDRAYTSATAWIYDNNIHCRVLATEVTTLCNFIIKYTKS